MSMFSILQASRFRLLLSIPVNFLEERSENSGEQAKFYS